MSPSHTSIIRASCWNPGCHTRCREQQILLVALNARAAARPLYESLGYRAGVSPMLFFALE